MYKVEHYLKHSGSCVWSFTARVEFVSLMGTYLSNVLRALACGWRTCAPKGKMESVGHKTMTKRCVAKGDIKSAQELFAQIESDGLKPTDVIYNCIIITLITLN